MNAQSTLGGPDKTIDIYLSNKVEPFRYSNLARPVLPNGTSHSFLT